LGIQNLVDTQDLTVLKTSKKGDKENSLIFTDVIENFFFFMKEDGTY